MKLRLGFFAATAVLAGSAMAQDLTVAVSTAQINSGAGTTVASPRYLAATTTGSLITANSGATGTGAPASATTDFRILSIDISGSPVVTVLATGTDLSNAVTAAGGTPPATMTVRGMAVTANGNVILGTDDTGGSFLFKITAPHVVSVITGTGGGQSPVDGCNRVGAVGNIAMVLINDAFASPATSDHIQGFDVTLPATGSQAGVEYASSAALLAAIPGSSATTIVLNAPVALSATKMLFANSGGSAGTDEILTVDTSNNVALLKTKATMMTEVNNPSDTDLGFGAAAYQSSSQRVFLTNSFGTAAGTDDDIFQIPTNGTGTTSVFVTDSTLEADADFPSAQQLNYPGDNIVVIGSNMYLADAGTNQIYKIAIAPAAVSEWSLY